MARVSHVVLLVVAVGCSNPEPRKDPHPASVKVATPLLRSGLDATCFDPKVRPQDDLFRAVSGAWLASTEIPADRSGFGAFEHLREKTENDLHAIVDAAQGEPGSEGRKVADFYAAYMDEKRVEERGLAPISSELAAIDAIETKADLVKRLAALQRIGVSGAFWIHVGIDARKSDSYILTLGQDGLGLPDRDYYLNQKYAAKLALYRPHVENVLRLCGRTDAENAAGSIVELEKEIALVHWSREESRDDSKTHNKMTRAELAALAPGFDWDLFLDSVGAQRETVVEVEQPSYLTGFAKLVESVPLATWKVWLSWRVVHHFSDVLPKEVVAEEFDFYGHHMRGIGEQRVRWKRGVESVQRNLGEALGKLYVALHYPPEAEARMETLVQNLIAAYRKRFETNDWMSPETREKALAKLAAFRPKIGHTKKWRDYSALEVRPDDLVGNVCRSATFEWERNLKRLGGPVDKDEWHMTPQTVNAYYSSNENEIVFPAAILQPPFFDLAADDAVNYGGIGAVIGHEIGHGFDDQGSKWDGAGNLVDWWTKADRAEFEKRANALAEQYSRFEPYPGHRVNGKLTLGENLGDLGGVTIAHVAYRMSLGGKEAPVIDGLTGDQRFFMSFAQIWRGKTREDEAKQRLATDPHSPPEYRANGSVRNVDAFYEAFGVKEGDRMFLKPEERVRIW
jgi:predicted metalloendopeptidase